MKNFKNLFVMIFVVVALILVAPACKTQDVDPIEQDDAEFVSMTPIVTARDDDSAIVQIMFVFRVRASAFTRLEGEAYIGKQTRLIGVDVNSTNGEWKEVSKTSQECIQKFGTHEVSGWVVLLSTGKKVTIPATLFTI